MVGRPEALAAPIAKHSKPRWRKVGDYLISWIASSSFATTALGTTA
jgi:hypothetical protein